MSYKDSFEKDGFLYIAMQFCEGGDLYNKLKEQRGTLLDERQLVEWFVQIAMALQVRILIFRAQESRRLRPNEKKYLCLG